MFLWICKFAPRKNVGKLLLCVVSAAAFLWVLFVLLAKVCSLHFLYICHFVEMCLLDMFFSKSYTIYQRIFLLSSLTFSWKFPTTPAVLLLEINIVYEFSNRFRIQQRIQKSYFSLRSYNRILSILVLSYKNISKTFKGLQEV